MQESQAKGQITQDWISLTRITGEPIDKTALIIELIQNIEKQVEKYLQNGLAPFLSLWFDFDNHLNKKVRILKEQTETIGVAKGIDINGALLVEVNGKLVSFHSSEVSLRAVKE